ncbi:uncharacterized protein NFIA_048220 [Aspergillus fischeri NRRL 181]|uniref:Uncharacterized protein n=1 Tax=Neosartorya fischeri (strain ATCC 1020 / DSM 3700 / CBS 544.65 / FGSC A1164 / JCM 1740 / NRRL 181 / WB 181) TaxID=331117 RepID=A1DL14_NEOFI|nr:uncharacterized protein NFIA_048220 [Aspergillus fischeri NRRL 181]EAW15485.1 hypothetical protein NFIA_048220 [Aspergillus fischeri NRRL 181]
MHIPDRRGVVAEVAAKHHLTLTAQEKSLLSSFISAALKWRLLATIVLSQGSCANCLWNGKSAKCNYYLSHTQGWNSDDSVTILQAGGLLQALGSSPTLRDIPPQVEEVVNDPIEEQSNVSRASHTPHKSTTPPSASVTAHTPSVEAGAGRISRRSSAVKPSVIKGSSSMIDKGEGFLSKRPRETPSFGSTPSKKRRRNPLDGEVLPWPVSMVDFEDLDRLRLTFN